MELLTYFKKNNKNLFDTINEQKILTDEQEDEIVQMVNDFKQNLWGE